jgi:hypothetical protein
MEKRAWAGSLWKENPNTNSVNIWKVTQHTSNHEKPMQNQNEIPTTDQPEWLKVEKMDKTMHLRMESNRNPYILVVELELGILCKLFLIFY